MRAFVMEGFGSPGRASVGTLPKPECRPDDLLVRVVAAGVNPTDWKEMEGNLVAFYPPYEPRWAPGFDGAGIVEEIGSAVSGFRPGDQVVLLSDRRGGQSGTFAEYVRVDQKLAAKAPTSISLSETASIPVAGLTAYQALYRADMGAVRRGHSILIHGASGGLGSFVACFARAADLRVAGTCRAENEAYLRDLGVARTINYVSENITDAVRDWAPGGVNLIIDAVSGGTQSELLDCLAPGGRLVVIATVTDDGDIQALGAEAARRGKSLHFLLLDHTTIADDLKDIALLIDRGGMQMPPITRYPLDRAAEALGAMKSGKIRGKLVVGIADPG